MRYVSDERRTADGGRPRAIRGVPSSEFRAAGCGLPLAPRRSVFAAGRFVRALALLLLAIAAALPVGAQEQKGSKPFVTILCRFADSAAETPRPKSWYEGVMGSTAPGMDHYWRELS